MGLREQLGGMAEAALNEALDDLFKKEDGSEDVFDDLGKQVAKLLRDKLGAGFVEKVKANYIDRLDGEDDIEDV